MPDPNTGDFTTADIVAIREALASGVSSAAHADKRFAYRSVSELKEILRLLEARVAGSNRPRNSGLARFSRGLR